MIKNKTRLYHTFEYPKSQIFKRGAALPSNNVFSNFKSRWHTCFIQEFKSRNSSQRHLIVSSNLKSLCNWFKFQDYMRRTCTYHWMTIANTRYKLLEEESRLHHQIIDVKCTRREYYTQMSNNDKNLILTESPCIAYSLE